MNIICRGAKIFARAAEHEIPELVYLAHYYTAFDGAEMGITNRLEARPKGNFSIDAAAEKYGFIVLGQNQYGYTNTYTLACTKETVGNSVELANLLHEVCGYEYAAPDFIVYSYPIK